MTETLPPAATPTERRPHGKGRARWIVQQWASGYEPSVGAAPIGAWCTAMTGWMRQELDQGHMTGPMMWGDPADLATTCRNWMSADPGSPAGVDPHACDDMVAWMASHAGDWGGWMMSGHMMGR